MNILILQRVNCRAAAGVQELLLPCLCTAPSIKGNWLGQLVATSIQMLWIVSPSYSILLSEKRVLLFTRFIVDNKLLVPLCQLLTIRPGQSYLCTKGSRACAAAYTQCVRQTSCCHCMGWDNRLLWCVAGVLLWVFLATITGGLHVLHMAAYMLTGFLVDHYLLPLHLFLRGVLLISYLIFRPYLIMTGFLCIVRV